MRFLRGLCVAVALLGWVGFSAAMAAQVAVMGTLAGGLFVGVAAFIIPVVAWLFERDYNTGGCLMFIVELVWTVCAMLAAGALLMTMMHLFWAIMLTLSVILIWVYCVAVVSSALKGN